jgi:formylglycine-generating enzyme required for sulfatase activity
MQYSLLGVLVMILGLISHAALGDNAPQNNHASQDSGSEEVLKASPILDSDEYTPNRTAYMVYESINNQGLAEKGNFTEMTFYVAPLFRLIPAPDTQKAYGRTELKEEGIVQYRFFVECFAERIDEQALKTINEHYSAKTKGKYVFQSDKVQHMRHGMVVIEPTNLPPRLAQLIKPARKPANKEAAPNTIVLLDAIEEFTIDVPLEVDSSFKHLLDNSGIHFDFTVYFNVMNLSKVQITWSVSDVRQTKTYKQLDSGSAHYVTATQVNEIIREAAELNNVYHYQDPDIEEKIWQKSMNIFQQLGGDMQNITVRNRQQATEIEAKLREGTGLSPSEFKPITLMWDVSEQLQNVTDYQTANKLIRDTYNSNKVNFNSLYDVSQRRKATAKDAGRRYDYDKNTSAEMDFRVKSSGDIGWGVTSFDWKADLDYDYHRQDKQAVKEREANFSRDNMRDKSTKNAYRRDIAEKRIQKGYFNDNNDLKEYQITARQAKGQEIKIVGRGLNVVERSKFEQKIEKMGNYLFVQPMMEAKSFTASSNISAHSKLGAISTTDKLLEHDRKLEAMNKKLTLLWQQSQTRFRDKLKNNTLGPEMIWISAGLFRMGDIQRGGYPDEQAVQEISVNRFAIGRYEVTFAEYDLFATATGRKKPNDNGWGRGKRPVINVSWEDAIAYAKWLSQQTGKQYRLPTEAEWEYSARAGTTTAYWWGNQVESNRANCDGCGSYWDNDRTAEVGSFSPNPFGLYDTVGNVGEWLCSAYEYKYKGKEQQCLNKNRSEFRVIRGGFWNTSPNNVRAASRSGNPVIYYSNRVGFRLARDTEGTD